MRSRIITGYGHWGIIIALGAAMGAYMAMGCGSSSSGSSDLTGSTPGTTATDTSSLKTVPTTDISSYDPTTSSSASSSESVPIGKSLAKVEGNKAAENKYDTRHEGVSSRAGCEQNMHKKEIIRFSQQSQLDRCYIQAFEEAGIITIPTDGTRKAYGFIPPAEKSDDRGKKCEGIPPERTKEREACLNGNEGPSGGSIAARVGIIDNALQIDVCSGTSLGALTLENESTYTGGETPGFKVIRIGKHGGGTEKNTISGTLSGVTSISNGEVTLGDNGKVSVTASMNGGFGSGSIAFDANTLNYTLSGGFKGSFKDPFSESETNFTGKAYAKVGKDKSTDTAIRGTAKFSFTGAPPAMPLSNMIPFEMSGNQLENFLKTFGAEMGMTLTLSNYKDVYVCPNPDFNPESPSLTIKPMTQVAKGAACESITHTGVESFEVTNVQETGNFGRKIEQTFKSIANISSPFYTEVNAKDLSTVLADASAIAFERNWDCKGIEATLDMSDPSKLPSDILSKLSALEAGMQKCFALEERGRDNAGMGGYNCDGEEMSVVAENIKDEPPSFGNAGGDYTRGGGSPEACAPTGTKLSPERFFANAIDPAQNKYCIPMNGTCSEFTVTSSTVSGLDISLADYLKITQIAFGAGTGVSTKATTANVSFLFNTGQGTATCTDTYTISQPTFDKPSGPPPAGELPEKCRNNSITDPETCRQFCSKPENKCF